jgi:hypothetical protein
MRPAGGAEAVEVGTDRASAAAGCALLFAHCIVLEGSSKLVKMGGAER